MQGQEERLVEPKWTKLEHILKEKWLTMMYVKSSLT